MTTIINTPTRTLHRLAALSFGAGQPLHSAATRGSRSQDIHKRSSGKVGSASCARHRNSFVAWMLTDPMIRLVMAAEIRQLYCGILDEGLGSRTAMPKGKQSAPAPATPAPGPVPSSLRPGIGE